MSSGGFTKTWCGSKFIQLEPFELDLGIVVLVLPLVLLPLRMLLEHLLLKVMFEPVVPSVSLLRLAIILRIVWL